MWRHLTVILFTISFLLPKPQTTLKYQKIREHPTCSQVFFSPSVILSQSRWVNFWRNSLRMCKSDLEPFLSRKEWVIAKDNEQLLKTPTLSPKNPSLKNVSFIFQTKRSNFHNSFMPFNHEDIFDREHVDILFYVVFSDNKTKIVCSKIACLSYNKQPYVQQIQFSISRVNWQKAKVAWLVKSMTTVRALKYTLKRQLYLTKIIW